MKRRPKENHLGRPGLSGRYLVAAILGCSVVTGGCTGPWRSVDLRQSAWESDSPEHPEIPPADSEFAQEGPLLLPDPDEPDLDGMIPSEDIALDWPRREDEIAAKSDPLGEPGPVHVASVMSPPGPGSDFPLPTLPDGPDARAQQVLRMEQVLELALAHHPLLRARKHQVEVARAQLVSAGLMPNPQLVMDAESPIQQNDPTTLTMRMMFTIPTAGKIHRRKAVASAGILRAKHVLSRESEAVIAEAADAALQVLYYQELAGLQAQLGQTAAREAGIQRGRFEAGEARFVDKVQADIDAAAIELDRRNTLTRLNVARMRLCRAMGMTVPRLVKIDGRFLIEPLPRVPLETILTRARGIRPELAEARAALSQSRRQLALAHAEAHPDLIVGPRFQDQLGEADDEVGGRLNVDLPLFDRNQGGIYAGRAQVRVSQAQTRVTELATLNDVAVAYLELTATQSSLRYYEDYVTPLLERTQADFLQEFGNQAISPDQISALLREFARMRISYLQLQYRCAQLRTRLELLLGCRIAELQPPPWQGQPPPWQGQPEPIPAPLALEDAEID